MIGRARARRSGSAGPAARPAETTLPARSDVVTRLVALEPGLYAVGMRGAARRRGGPAGLALPAVHVAAAPAANGAGDTAIEITDILGRRGEWLGGSDTALFLKAPEGGTALVTAHLPRDPRSPPLVLELRRLDAAPDGDAAVWTLDLGGPAAEEAAGWSSLEIVAHIRTRGDLRFVDAAWAGRLGRGLWLESFLVLPQDPMIAGAVEYKGLAADGSETDWVSGGARCGTAGRGLPLIGFAVRQKAAPGGVRVDCEYSGYFASGTTTGPMRNGAPCRSPRDNDPLEGMQLRLTRLPPRPAT